MNHLGELGALTLRTYVEPNNKPSIELQKDLGFTKSPFEKFNNLINDDQIMFDFGLPRPYSVIPATEDEADFVMMFYQQNIDYLHGKPSSLDEWKAILSNNDVDEGLLRI